MKRSEMLTLMVNSWKKYLQNIKNADEAGVRNGMKAVLKDIEDSKGMVPFPKIKFLDLTGGHEGDYIVYEWDDE